MTTFKMPEPVSEATEYKNLSASVQVLNGPGRVLGVLCASSSSGTLKVWDSLSAANDILVNTMSLTAGTFYPMPAYCKTGLFCTIGGTADITVFAAKL